MAGGLEKGDSGVLQGGREIGGLLIEIEAESEQGERWLLFSRDGFDEDTCDFTILEEEIVGPF